MSATGHVIKPASLATPDFGEMDASDLRRFAALNGVTLPAELGMDRDDLEREIRRQGPMAMGAVCEDCREGRVHDVAACPAAPIRALMEPE